MIEQLTSRERNVLEKALDGGSNREIAKSLNVQPGTVNKHFYNITKRLGLRNKLTACLAYSDEKAYLERQQRYMSLSIDD